MKVVIICGGTPPSKKLVLDEINDSKFIICADSGANCLYQYKILPNIIIGDLDSIDMEALDYFRNNEINIIKYPPEKDYTDTEISLRKAIDLGADEIVLLGAVGSRIDHLLGNISMLLKALEMNVDAKIRDEKNLLRIVNKSTKIYGKKGELFSLQPFSDEVSNLTIKGAKYNLQNFNLHIGNALTISNEFLENEVEIDFEKGNLLIILSKD